MHIGFDNQPGEPAHIEIEFVGRSFAIGTIDNDIGMSGIGKRSPVRLENAQFIDDILLSFKTRFGRNHFNKGRLVLDQGLEARIR